MARSIPPCPDAPPVSEPAVHAVEHTFELVTPLFGGGVEAGQLDPVTPIRPTSIRGHLRFWWRATRGAGLDPARLSEREAEIWGSTENPSPVWVEVISVEKHGVRRGPDFDYPRFGPEAYALFSAKQNEVKELAREGLTFTLRLRWPAHARLQERRDAENAQRKQRGATDLLPPRIEDIAADVESALWAWANFGGLGARTRRGCGALSCRDFAPPSSDAIDGWFRAVVNRSGLTFTPRPWPTLSGPPLAHREAGDTAEVWAWLLDLYKYARQGEGFGRNPGTVRNRPGRSRYPEPETIRAATGRRSSRHARLAAVPDDAVPRAEFGLPIVFHFKDERDGDPPDTMLVPSVGGEPMSRMASPLVLKPLVLNDGTAVPAILRLHDPGLTDVELVPIGGGKSLGTWAVGSIRDPRLARYRNSPLASSPQGSAIEAFLALARREGFR